MPGIAGIAVPGRRAVVERMLDKMAHRGGAGRGVNEVDGATLGAIWPRGAMPCLPGADGVVRDQTCESRYAVARVVNGKFLLRRDMLGVAPLYYGLTPDGIMCFASEVKALLEVTGDVHELPPASRLSESQLEVASMLRPLPVLTDAPEKIVADLACWLGAAVKNCIRRTEMGSWLSGGLDSSVIAAMARPHVRTLHTVAAGIEGAPDLEYARCAAAHLQAEHHEVVVTAQDMLSILPTVIWHLESFDALLVRSSIMNYLAARRIAEYVPEVFSGEGGDELFAGYSYLKQLEVGRLADELLDITGRLHNTALQRVDRCAAAHGLVVHVPFADPDVVDYAMRIPVSLKIRDGVEKWILRQTVPGRLPQAVLDRPKAKFWEGAGVDVLLSNYADEKISDADFARERNLPNGWSLTSKEELLYYRIFAEHFGGVADLSWMGRTKAAPA